MPMMATDRIKNLSCRYLWLVDSWILPEETIKGYQSFTKESTKPTEIPFPVSSLGISQCSLPEGRRDGAWALW
jgi:hypothetical protein